MVLGSRTGLAARPLSEFGGRECVLGLVSIGDIDTARVGSRFGGQCASLRFIAVAGSAGGRMSRGICAPGDAAAGVRVA